MAERLRNITGYISGRIGELPADYNLPPDQQPLQASLDELLRVEENNYLKLLTLYEVVESLGNVVSPQFEAQVEALAQRYNFRQKEMIQEDWATDLKAGIRSGWEWLANKFSFPSGIGAFPIIAVAIIAAVAVVGSVAVISIPQALTEAKQDGDTMNELLGMVKADPTVKGSDIMQLIAKLEEDENDSGGTFDKLLDKGAMLVIGGLAAFAAVKYGPGLIDKLMGKRA